MQTLAPLFFDPTAFLADLGLTWTKLVVGASLTTIVLLFALREFSYWFFRINKILAKQDLILAQLETITGEKKNSSTGGGGIKQKLESEIPVSTGFPIPKMKSESHVEYPLDF